MMTKRVPSRECPINARGFLILEGLIKHNGENGIIAEGVNQAQTNIELE